MQPAQHVDEPFVQVLDIHLLGCFFPFAADELFDFLVGLADDFFDPRRMNAAVGDQLFQGLAGDFAADRIEPADDHHSGRVVDDHVHARPLFKRANVAAFAADDPPLHFVAGDIDGAGRAFRGVGRGVAVQGGEEHLPR